ncbi:hypothetical protein EAG_05939 [Camponotus floridanus]|uniref:Uncharacterized protein n=1 Tax=Camponotus floridanus TaxID=104421 RepID=E2AY39_CAMFO|nr:hypothetical protein EAG_05939 [Camponotus floridanus]
MLIRCILNQFEGIVTPYTFIAPDPRPLGPGARVTLRRNISSSWDHRRNYPLMPIHKSVGHFQSPARNSRRNTAAIQPHTDAGTADTPTFGYTGWRWGKGDKRGHEDERTFGPKAHRSFMGHLLGIPVKPISFLRPLPSFSLPSTAHPATPLVPPYIILLSAGMDWDQADIISSSRIHFRAPLTTIAVPRRNLGGVTTAIRLA